MYTAVSVGRINTVQHCFPSKSVFIPVHSAMGRISPPVMPQLAQPHRLLLDYSNYVNISIGTSELLPYFRQSSLTHIMLILMSLWTKCHHPFPHWQMRKLWFRELEFVVQSDTAGNYVNGESGIKALVYWAPKLKSETTARKNSASKPTRRLCFLICTVARDWQNICPFEGKGLLWRLLRIARKGNPKCSLSVWETEIPDHRKWLFKGKKGPSDSCAGCFGIFYGSLAFLIPFVSVWLLCDHLFTINQAVQWQGQGACLSWHKPTSSTVKNSPVLLSRWQVGWEESLLYKKVGVFAFQDWAQVSLHWSVTPQQRHKTHYPSLPRTRVAQFHSLLHFP